MKALLIMNLAILSVFNVYAETAAALNVPPSPVNAEYIEASAEIPLKPKQKLANLFRLNQTEPFILQRLTDKTYFFQRHDYATTFYVGDKGVLVFDPLEDRGEYLLKAIKQVTTLPVMAIVYSHAHYDHLGDAKIFTEAAKKSGIKLRIIASSATNKKLEYIKSELPRPTEIISWPKGQLKFENLTVKLNGFQRAAHTDDHAVWLLAEEKVLHAADHMNPDQLPFWNFGGSENYLYYRDNLKEAYALDWTFINAGHGNIGSKEDYNFYFKFLNDLEKATQSAMKSTPWGINIDQAKVNNHAAYMVEWRSVVRKKVTDSLRPVYGKYYGFEYSVPYNADMVALSKSEYR